MTHPVSNRLVEERPVRVAYSTHRRFLECPFQEALLRAGGPCSPKRRRPYLVGNVVHQTMEYVAQYRELPTFQWLVGCYNHHAARVGLDEWLTDRDDNLGRWEQSRLAASKLGEWLLGFLKRVGPHLLRVDVEPYYGYQFTTPAGHPFIMESRPDLALVLGDPGSPAEVLIFDWKTGSSRLDPIQLAWYEAVTAQHDSYTDGSPSIQSRFVRLSSSDDPKVKVSSPISPALREEAIRLAGTVADRLLSSDWPASPDRWRCRDCRVSASCSASVAPGDLTTRLPTRNRVGTS